MVQVEPKTKRPQKKKEKGMSSQPSEAVSKQRNNKKKRKDGRGAASTRTTQQHHPKNNRKNKKRKRADDDKNEPRTGEAQWSKSKKKRMRLLKAKQTKAAAKNASDVKAAVPAHPSSSDDNVGRIPTAPNSSTRTVETSKPSTSSGTNPNTNTTTTTNQPSSLQKSFQERLSGSRFRILNEELYTTTSQAAYDRFRKQPELFDEYHAGFRHQVEHWPVNPVQVLVDKLKRQQKKSQQTQLVVADFGCGDAELGQQLLSSSPQQQSSSPSFVVHSLDLVARGPHANRITACDCAHTPLAAQSVDVGVFCLSLMGTNLADFVREAHRVLRPKARLHIAEVRSRFEGARPQKSNDKKKKGEHGGGEPQQDPLQAFVGALEKLGFDCVQTDRSNKMFVLLELQKNGQEPDRGLTFTAKPCIYKRR